MAGLAMMSDQIMEPNGESAKGTLNNSSSESMLAMVKAQREAFSQSYNGDGDSTLDDDRTKLDSAWPSFWANRRNYPPLMSSLGENGRPLYYFKSVREEGRHVMKVFEHDAKLSYFFRSRREDGRLVIKMFKYPPTRPTENGTLGEEEPELGDGNLPGEEDAAGEIEPGLIDHEAEEDGGAADHHAVEGDDISRVGVPN